MIQKIDYLLARARRSEILVVLALGLGVLGLYMATLLPGIGRRDTAEFQWVAPTLGLAHPTGYPLYTVLGWLWSKLPLGGTAAWRMNVFSAVSGAAAVVMLFRISRVLGQPVAIAFGAAATLAASLAFWSQATIAEVYALAVLLQFGLYMALLRWRARQWPLWIAGMIAGLMLAHHRTSVLLLPGAALFVLLARRPRLGELLGAAFAVLLGCLSYLYLLLHMPLGGDPRQFLWTYAVGSDLAANWLDPARFAAEGWSRVSDLVIRFIVPQFGLAGLALTLVGIVVVSSRDRALAGLLLCGYVLTAAFCAAYYVDDIEVFFLPAHAISALLLGEGAWALTCWSRRVTARGTSNGATASLHVAGAAIPTVLVTAALPVMLLLGNMPNIRALNTIEPEAEARQAIIQPMPQGSLVIGNWYATEGLRYLQAVEGYRPDIELGLVPDRSFILDQIARGRAVYLLESNPSLGLTQVPEGSLWRVKQQPLNGETRLDIRWNEGLNLQNFTLNSGPYHPGEAVPLTLGWRTTAPLPTCYRLFVHLVADDGQIAGQQDREPSVLPTDQWHEDQEYVDLYSPVIQEHVRPGRYRVNIGWYDPVTLQRLPLANSSADFVTLGVIDVAR